MKKHAYLIISHNEFYVLQQLLRLIDDKRNDIYIHIDKKVKDIDIKQIKKIVKYSGIFFIDRINVNWGGYSQIEVELHLLKEAVKKNYAYYHIISGTDLSIKNQDDIHSFFERNEGKEFIGYVDKWDIARIKYIYLFNEELREEATLKKIFTKCSRKIFICLQKLLRYNRTKKFKDIIFKKGSNWVSITHQCANLIISKEKLIQEMFRYAICADEVFIQTIYYNFGDHKKLYSEMGNELDGSKRLIDWNRGTPYIFRLEDFNTIVESDKMFARKFSAAVDQRVIDKIVQYVLSSKDNATESH